MTELVFILDRSGSMAYRLEMQEFIDCIAEGRKPGVTVYDGTKSTDIAFKTTESWKSGAIVKI